MENVALDHELLQLIHNYRRQSFTSPAVKLLSRDESNREELKEPLRQMYQLQDMLHQDSKGNRLEPVTMSTKGRYTPCAENADVLMPVTFNDNINIQDTAGCVSANNIIGATTHEVVKALLKQRVYRSICRRNAEKLKSERAHVEALLAQIETVETVPVGESQDETTHVKADTTAEMAELLPEEISKLSLESFTISKKEKDDETGSEPPLKKSDQEMQVEVDKQLEARDESGKQTGSKKEQGEIKRRDFEVEEKTVMLLQMKKIQEAIESELPLSIRVVLLDTVIPIVEETYKKYKKVLGDQHTLTEVCVKRLKGLKQERSLYFE